MTATNPCPDPARAPQPRWTREQIRAARTAPLVPLLQKRGLQLLELPASESRGIHAPEHSGNQVSRAIRAAQGDGPTEIRVIPDSTP